MKRIALLWTLIMCLMLCSCKNNTGSAVETSEPVSTSAETPAPTQEPTPTPEPTPRPSEVFVTEYEATDILSGERVNKQMSVYLPEGYDEGEKYNAVFLMHISGADETFWPNMGIHTIMDEMIANGDIEKTIVFMPDGYINDEFRTHRGDDNIYYQFASELRNDLLPFIKQYYGVYDTRDHYAFVGASFGSYMTVNSVLGPNIDLISNFGCIGGGTIDQWRLESEWNENGMGDMDISMLYIAEGEYDDRGPAELSSINLRNYCDKFSEDNLVFSLIENVGHDENEWILGFKESLTLFEF